MSNLSGIGLGLGTRLCGGAFTNSSFIYDFPGASAAYSLRDLTSGDPNVVRVRRDSDNNERDFKASEVANGTLKNWVNAQNILPLDLRTLEADGRTGAIIDAKAAYSLRNLSSSYTGNVVRVRRNIDGSERDFTAAEVSDGTLTTWVNESFNDALPLDTSSGASAAYSLRNLSSSYSGNVVEVRRSSDGNTQPFTASEVSDGTMTDWVTASLDIVTPTLNNGGFETAGTNGFDYWIETTHGSSTITRDTSEFYSGTASCRFDVDSSASFTGIRTPVSGGVFNVGTTLTYSIRAKGTSGSQLLIGTAGNDSRNDTLNLTTEWQEYTGTVNPADTDSNIQIKRKDSANATIWIDEVTFTINGKDGHVKTWYDQSGNSNDATQTTPDNQPKIVDGGSLVQRNGNPAVQSTSNNHLEFTLDSLSANGRQSVFAVLENDVTSQDGFGRVFRVTSTSTGVGGVNRRPWWFGSPTGDLSFTVDSESGHTNSDRDYRLYSHIMNGTAGGTSTIRRDGTQLDTRSITLDENSNFSVGKLAGVTNNATGALYMSEVIYYPSDQSTKRRALEENIANHYGITLSSFSRDGFVKTWYDQSSTTGTANNNHATQSDPSKQPKIVEGGNLFTGGVDFDGSTTQLDITGFSPVSLTYGAFTVASIDDNTSSSLRTIFDSSDSSDGGFAVAYGNTTSKFTPFWFDGDDAQPNLFTGGNNMTSSESLYSLILKTGASTTHINGSLNETVTNTWTTAGSNTLSKSTIGYDQSNPGRQFNGRLQELIIYDTDQTDNRTALEANIGEHYSISGIPAYDNTVNGFVETFYDQSGNGNDATQSSADAQPKIVESGTLLDGAKFDGTDDVLQATSITEITGPALSIFVVSERTVSGTTASLNNLTNGTINMVVRDSGNTGQMAIRNTTNRLVSDSVSGDSRLNFASTTGNTDYKVGTNGTAVTSGTDSYGSDFESGDLDTVLIGARRPNNLFDFYTGLVKEVVVYNSDQSSNRTAVETNINGHYSIY